MRRATILGNPCAGCPAISIHALLAESDEPETAYTDSAKTISIHALLAESDQLGAVISTLVAGFLSTLSLRRATWGSKPQQPWHCNFYPRSPCGERRNNSNNELVCTVFLSTLSLRRATTHVTITAYGMAFLSTLSLRRATPTDQTITITGRYFYPRSPCGERRQNPGEHYVAFRFLSTLSLRRATELWKLLYPGRTNFYPRSPCGERPQLLDPGLDVLGFLSTLSLRRATRGRLLLCPGGNHFYPRSPCGERRPAPRGRRGHADFYPRSPCGERHDQVVVEASRYQFLSTLSLRRATHGTNTGTNSSIFLSTLSLRRATGAFYEIVDDNNISIHALLAESDVSLMLYNTSSLIFLSTLSLRRATG